MLTPEIEKLVYPIIRDKCSKYKAKAIAIGNTFDHVHLMLMIDPVTNISTLIKEIKGAASFAVNHETNSCLYWQDGFGALSVGKHECDKIKNYVEKQKEHHNINDLMSVFEKDVI
jgi:putative transposase